jgi:hypothetical protein
MVHETTTIYLRRCSEVVVICIVSPVTRFSTTFARRDTTYKKKKMNSSIVVNRHLTANYISWKK